MLAAMKHRVWSTQRGWGKKRGRVGDTGNTTSKRVLHVMLDRKMQRT